MAASRGGALRAPLGGGGGGSCAGAGGGGGGRWGGMSRDLLEAILARVGAPDLVAAVPFVCSSWREASRDPLFWRRLDLGDWDAVSRRLRRGGGGGGTAAAEFAGILRVAVARGRGRTESISFPSFADEAHLLFVAERCSNLLYFSLPNPRIASDRFCEAVAKLKLLKGMAVDESLITNEVLLHIKNCCKNFSELRVCAESVNREIASVICKSLPNLKKLEITNSVISKQAIITLLDGLEQLEHFDISGYRNSTITDLVLQKASRLKVFLWDSKLELGELMDCSHCEDGLVLQRPCECVLNQRVMEWLAEVS
ncbi:F-box/LRR-repeat protein At3g48880-like [Ananas comosus]|uniref:F-box/LRR-repeat protein n=1 Tax=Ananas comosus TaxID=4615 RepID=A0A199VYM8_ANACO|nr:F-box/LRR-repeat protein At3g48880-like [Ananas comosus]OAY82104.1 F-box/LRR-repeat protein [Ananas comosus]